MPDLINHTENRPRVREGCGCSCDSDVEARKLKDNAEMKHRDRRSETLSRIAAYLKSYEASDELDEDSILSISSKLDESRSLRHRMKNIIYTKINGLIPKNKIPDFEFKSDVEDSYGYEGNAAKEEDSTLKSIRSIVTEAYVSYIDADFLFDIVDGIEKDSDDFLLDDETISSLRQSLIITNNEKKRKRRDLKLSILPDDKVFDQDDSSEILLTSNRSTRGTLRGSKHENQWEEFDGICHLLNAMVESEMRNGRSVDLVGDIQQELSLKRRLRKRRKKDTELEMIDPKMINQHCKDEFKVSASPKKNNRNTKNQESERMLSSPRKLDKNKSISRGKFSKNTETDSIHKTTGKNNLFTVDGVEDPILAWRLLENRWNLSPSTLEPKRTRHPDRIYGNFSCSLLNSLKGKSRVFARHEFFYSDIDKAWFNENLFHKELISLGISPHASFTMKEWSAIRRKISKRSPRRFSRQFIDMQFQQLNQYRRRVRKIQKCQFMGEAIENDPNFEFEVLTPPKVGSLVTAYCHKVHLLHRGTVLSHDYDTGSYLIQFEKKSLGHAWCPDFEVSSHGLQEVITPGTKNKLHPEEVHSVSFNLYGSLPQGTSFNFITDYLKRISEEGNAKKKMEECKDTITSILSRRYMSDFIEISNAIDERDSLALIMSTIDSLIERKEVLLRAIDETNLEVSKRFQANEDIQPPSSILDQFEWLLSNYEITEEALQTAFIHLKIIYGTAWDDKNIVISTREEQTTMDSSRHDVEASDSSIKWRNTIESCALEFSNEIKRNLHNRESEHAIISSSAGLLATLNILSDTVHDASISDSEILHDTLNAQLDPLKPTILYRANLSEKVQEAVRLQNESFKDLKDSIEIFLTALSRRQNVS